MSKAKSFAEQIEELQATSEKVSGYEKLFSKACEINFGCNAKSIKKMLENNEEPCSNFETKMRSFFGLKTEKDIDLKFSPEQKEKALVIADEGSHVLALVGYRIDESVKVEPALRQAQGPVVRIRLI